MHSEWGLNFSIAESAFETGVVGPLGPGTKSVESKPPLESRLCLQAILETGCNGTTCRHWRAGGGETFLAHGNQGHGNQPRAW